MQIKVVAGLIKRVIVKFWQKKLKAWILKD